MHEGILIMISLFVVVFGIFYLRYTTRNKERMALIEKGADASIFFSHKKKQTAPIWKIIVLNLSLLLMGIGIGIFLGAIIYGSINVEEGVAYAGSIFLMAGLGLFAGFTLTKKLDGDNQ